MPNVYLSGCPRQTRPSELPTAVLTERNLPSLPSNGGDGGVHYEDTSCTAFQSCPKSPARDNTNAEMLRQDCDRRRARRMLPAVILIDYGLPCWLVCARMGLSRLG